MTENYTPLSKEIKQTVWNMTRGKCWYCGSNTSREGIKQIKDNKRQFCVDHKFPKSRGGSDELSNLAPCCRSCNSAKTTRTIEEYRVWLQWSKSGRFTEEQINWLWWHGIDMPPQHTVEFYFETKRKR